MEITMAEAAEQYYSAADLAWPYWTPAIGFNHHEEVKGTVLWLSDNYPIDGGSPETFECWSSSGVSDTTFSSAAATPAEEFAGVDNNNKGVLLIHLLSAAAEAIIAGDHNSHELSRVILARLKELIPTTGASGTERLAGHFVAALRRLIDGGGSDNRFLRRTAELTTAFRLLQDMSPYANFGHFTANQAILEAVAGQRRVHIVDWDITDGGQWAPLMQAFVSSKDGLPPSNLKITAVTAGGKSESAAVRDTGNMLASFAASIGLPFTFAQCRVDKEGNFRPGAVKVLRGEAVVFNCAAHGNHHYGVETVKSFLAGAAAVGARVVTVAEEESGCGGGGFVGRFMEEVGRYRAIWEALERGFPKQGRAREMVENMVLGPRIWRGVERAYRRNGMENEGLGEWMEKEGFGKMRMSLFNKWQAKLLLGLFDDGYDVEEEGENKIVLRWKACRLVSASVWLVPELEKMVVEKW